MTLCIFRVEPDTFTKIAFSFSAVSTVKLDDSLKVHGFRGFLMIDSSERFGCFLCGSGFGQTLDFDEEEFFVFWDFLNEVGHARKSLTVILSFQGFVVFVEVGNVVLNLFDVIGGGLSLFDGTSQF